MSGTESWSSEALARPELDSHPDISEHFRRGTDSANAAGIEEIVRSLDPQSSVTLLKHLIKSLEGVDALVQALAPHELSENPLELAPHYLTGEVRLLIEWWFLPFLHRLKAEMSQADSQGQPEGVKQ